MQYVHNQCLHYHQQYYRVQYFLENCKNQVIVFIYNFSAIDSCYFNKIALFSQKWCKTTVVVLHHFSKTNMDTVTTVFCKILTKTK